MWEILGNILLALLILGTVFVVLLNDGEPGTKTAWLLVIILLPCIGIVLFAIFGVRYRRRWYFRWRHRKTAEYVKEKKSEINTLRKGRGSTVFIREDFRPLADLMQHAEGSPPVDNNEVEIITDGRRKLELLKEDIKNARHSIHVEYFHFGIDEASQSIRELLIQKAQEGVEVRFLYENVANFPIPSIYYDSMRKSGVQVMYFSGIRARLVNLINRLNYRNHRKIVVIDGKVAYTGGMNITKNYFYKWRDTHLRLSGEAALMLQFLFVDSWLNVGGVMSRPVNEYFPQPAVPAPSTSVPEQPLLENQVLQIVGDEPYSLWHPIKMCYEWVLYNAKQRIWLQTPYFSPSESVLQAVKNAALRGIDVRLMLPEVPDNLLTRKINKAYYEELLEAGVHIYLRKEFIHSKTFVADGYLSSIGTANLDCRSMDLCYEVNTLFYSETAAAMNERIFEEDMRTCRELTMEEWQNRRRSARLFERIARMFSALL